MTALACVGLSVGCIFVAVDRTKTARTYFMKNLLLLIVLCTGLPSQLFAQNSDKEIEFRSRLVGTWKFAEARDGDDKKIDTIWHPEMASLLGGINGWEYLPAR